MGLSAKVYRLLPKYTYRPASLAYMYTLLLPQAGVGVTVHRQVGSVNALTGGHSPSTYSLPGWWRWRRCPCVRRRGNVASKFVVRVETEVPRPEVLSRRGSANRLPLLPTCVVPRRRGNVQKLKTTGRYELVLPSLWSANSNDLSAVPCSQLSLWIWKGVSKFWWINLSSLAVIGYTKMGSK